MPSGTCAAGAARQGDGIVATINRKDIRTALKLALATAVTSAKLVERYLADPKGKSPAITLASRGSGGVGLTSDGDALEHKFYIHTLVVKGGGTGWTNENAEDALDTVRQAIDDYIEAQTLTVSGQLYNLYRDGNSEIVPVTIGSEQYLDEPIPIVVKAFYP
jgi:hypothetical protein